MPSRPVRPPMATIRSPGCGLLVRLVARDEADVAAVDERVAEVAVVEVDGAVDRGNAHAIAVVAHAVDDAAHHAPRMEHAGRQRVGRRVGRGEAEDVGVADRLRAQAGAHDVANDAADAGVRAAVGLERRGMVVRFDLEATLNSSSNRTTPALSSNTLTHQSSRPSWRANLLRGGEDRFLEHVLELPLAVLVAIGDAAGERLVAAMLAPGLGDRFQLDVGRIAAELAEVLADRLHLGQLQIELPLAAEAHQGVVVELADRHGADFEAIGPAEVEPRERQRADDDLLDGVVGQQALPMSRTIGVVDAGEPVLAERGGGLEWHAEIGRGGERALGDGIHHARLEQHGDALRRRRSHRVAMAASRSDSIARRREHAAIRRPDRRAIRGPAVRPAVGRASRLAPDSRGPRRRGDCRPVPTRGRRRRRAGRHDPPRPSPDECQSPRASRFDFIHLARSSMPYNCWSSPASSASRITATASVNRSRASSTWWRLAAKIGRHMFGSLPAIRVVSRQPLAAKGSNSFGVEKASA